jgi:alcohol dehydrogenase class IV
MRGREAYPRNASMVNTGCNALNMNSMDFIWRDGERTIRFGRGVVAGAVELLGGPGYLLLTTRRAAEAAPSVVEAAGAVQHVPGGLIPDLAAAALATAPGHERIVALGGGRVVDTAKAVAAALGVTAMAIPTTLSGAEMTRGHRHAAGIPERTARVRCAVVVYDPALAASQPLPELAASALNALGHAVEGPCTVAANPVATLAAGDAIARLTGAFAGPAPDRDELALGALLAGYTIDSTGFGLHHVMAQTLVRCGVAGHGQANAILLPHTARALARRFPERVDAGVADAAAQLCALTGATRLRELGVAREALDECVEVAAARRELAHTPPAADAAELREIYEAAW